MLTGAERNSLALTLGFLLLGSGLKLWTRATVELGPFPTLRAEASKSDAPPDPSAPAAVPASAEANPETRTDGSPVAALLAPEPGAGAVPEDSAGAIGGPDAAAPADMPGAEHVREAVGKGKGRSGGAARDSARKPKAPPAVKVDPNRATADELATVPGIGPKTAAAIVAYRREHGAFRDLSQLREVKGIGEKKWAAIAPCLSVAAARGGMTGDTARTGPESIR